jgi:hypothetical protein
MAQLTFRPGSFANSSVNEAGEEINTVKENSNVCIKSTCAQNQIQAYYIKCVHIIKVSPAYLLLIAAFN